MKNTRAYVINIKSIIKLITGFVLIIILTASVLFSIKTDKIRDYLIGYTQISDNIKKSFPVLSNTHISYTPVTLKNILSFIFNENMDNPSKLLCNRIAFLNSVKDKLSTQYSFVNESNYNYIPKVIEKIIKENKEEDIVYNDAIETTITSVKHDGNVLEQKGIVINNKAKYKLDLNSLYNEPLKLNKVKNKPQILIVHTHGSEGYNPTDRNQDINNNIVRVGTEMKKIFEKNNISVIHSTKMHDIPRFNNSYNNTLTTINTLINENPTINIVLDIHRDAMINEAGDVYKVVSDIKGTKASQIMFVVGTNKGGLKHDNWKENLKFAIKCQENVNKLSPNLARPIDLREERFNQHATLGSLIIEIGTNGNTLNESILSGKILAEAISEVINSLK